MSHDEDLGYSANSITWRSESPLLKDITYDFAPEYSTIGSRLIVLLNAAKRLYNFNRPGTVENAVISTRLIAAAIRVHSPAATTSLEWEVALKQQLACSEVTEHTRHSKYKVAASILREVADFDERSVLKTNNPWSRDGSVPTPDAERALLEKLLAHAKAAALGYRRDFLGASTGPNSSLLAKAVRIATENGGQLPQVESDTKSARALKELLTRARPFKPDITREWIARHLYATTESLLPFFILLVYSLAGNVDALADVKRDCQRKRLHIVHGNRIEIEIDKPRAGRNLYYPVVDSGTFSVPWILDFIGQYTAPLVPLADPRYQDRLMLCETRGYNNIWPLSAIKLSSVFKTYLNDNDLAGPLTLNMLRPSRAVEHFHDTRDPFRVQQLLQQKNIADTMRYLDHPSVHGMDSEIIADAIDDIQKLGAHVDSTRTNANRGDPMSLPSHICTDPNGGNEHDVDGLCVNVLWPLNDRHFILPLEPANVALLLRDYDAICEAQDSMLAERFSRLYAPRKQLIESKYLPRIGPELMAAARALLPTLAPAVWID